MMTSLEVKSMLYECMNRIDQLENLNEELRPGGADMDSYNSGYRAGLYTARQIISTYVLKVENIELANGVNKETDYDNG